MRRFCSGLLAFFLLLMCGCSGGGARKPIIYVVDGAYNLTPQEYIDLMNQTTDRQEDGDYLILPNWDERVAHTVNVTLSFDIGFEENDEGRITSIAYHWKNTTEAANTAAFLVGATINMLAVSDKQGNEIVNQLDMFNFEKKTYEKTYDVNGNHFYYMSANYGEHNWFSVNIIDSESATTTQVPQNETSESSSDPTESPVPTESAKDTRGILGSYAADIRMGLTEFGLEEAPFSSAPNEAKEVFAYSCTTSYEDQLLGVTYDYSLTLDSNFQVIGASFGISNNSAEEDAYQALAAIYLGFCATMPYDKSDAESAKQFVLDNLYEIDAKNNAETVIGDAKFELYGLKAGYHFGQYWLDISKVDE